ncbi:ABC-type sugar transport system ATPase subunit [Paraburkholderia sp. 35.1]
MVALARAVSSDAKMVIMDESTSSLDEREVELLFTVVRKLRDDGRAVIFVSHRLDELYALCDRVTVMRDGQTVVQSTMAEMDKLQLVTTMLDFRTPKQAREAGISTIYQEINLAPFRESERRRGREGSVAMTIAGVLLLGLVFNC